MSFIEWYKKWDKILDEEITRYFNILKPKFEDIFLVLKNPEGWVGIREYSSEWDKELNELMKNNLFIEIEGDEYEAFIGGEVIWIKNHPYASFHRSRDNGILLCDCVPKRSTRIKAMKKLNEDFLINKLSNKRRMRINFTGTFNFELEEVEG